MRHSRTNRVSNWIAFQLSHRYDSDAEFYVSSVRLRCDQDDASASVWERIGELLDSFQSLEFVDMELHVRLKHRNEEPHADFLSHLRKTVARIRGILKILDLQGKLRVRLHERRWMNNRPDTRDKLRNAIEEDLSHSENALKWDRLGVFATDADGQWV